MARARQRPKALEIDVIGMNSESAVRFKVTTKAFDVSTVVRRELEKRMPDWTEAHRSCIRECDGQIITSTLYNKG